MILVLGPPTLTTGEREVWGAGMAASFPKGAGGRWWHGACGKWEKEATPTTAWPCPSSSSSGQTHQQKVQRDDAREVGKGAETGVGMECISSRWQEEGSGEEWDWNDQELVCKGKVGECPAQFDKQDNYHITEKTGKEPCPCPHTQIQGEHVCKAQHVSGVYISSVWEIPNFP